MFKKEQGDRLAQKPRGVVTNLPSCHNRVFKLDVYKQLLAIQPKVIKWMLWGKKVLGPLIGWSNQVAPRPTRLANGQSH